MKILSISGTLVGSKTSLLTKKLSEDLQHKMPNTEMEFLDLKDVQLEFCAGKPIDQYNRDTQKVIGKIAEADAYIIGTTILHGSMPGVLKNLFELVPVEHFADKCVLFAATGGNSLHYLAIESSVKPVANYLKIFVLPEYIFATSSDFNEKNELTDKVQQEMNAILEKYVMYISKLMK